MKYQICKIEEAKKLLLEKDLFFSYKKISDLNACPICFEHLFSLNNKFMKECRYCKSIFIDEKYYNEHNKNISNVFIIGKKRKSEIIRYKKSCFYKGIRKKCNNSSCSQIKCSATKRLSCDFNEEHYKTT